MNDLIKSMYKSFGIPFTGIILAAFLFMLPKLMHDSFDFYRQSYYQIMGKGNE